MDKGDIFDHPLSEYAPCVSVPQLASDLSGIFPDVPDPAAVAAPFDFLPCPAAWIPVHNARSADCSQKHGCSKRCDISGGYER